MNGIHVCVLLLVAVGCRALAAGQATGCRTIAASGGDSVFVGVAQSYDPNEMSGPEGVGDARYVKPGDRMDYTIHFENASHALAAAQEIYVTLPKDEGLDWGTFELGEVVFGANADTSLSGSFDGTSLYALPGTNWSVQTSVSHTDASVVWYMRIIDPTTSDNFPDDALAGFLPPNDATGRGEGHLCYRVKVRDDAVPGSVINASATIHFDPTNGNEPIETDPAWSNTVALVRLIAIDGGAGYEGVDSLSLIAGLPYGELPAPGELTGCIFAGWYTGLGGTGRLVTSESIVQPDDECLHAHWRSDDDPLPPVGGDADVAAVMGALADARLAEDVKTVNEYNSLVGWADANGIDHKAVADSPHAWASYVLGAGALLESEPEIEIVDVAVAANAAGEAGDGETAAVQFIVSVTVKDGVSAIAVDAEKVAAMFEATSDLGDWYGTARLLVGAAALNAGNGGGGPLMRFKVSLPIGTRRAFLRIRK